MTSIMSLRLWGFLLDGRCATKVVGVQFCSGTLSAKMSSRTSAIGKHQAEGTRLLDPRSIFLFVFSSLMLLIPCVWQPHVGFGDFPSHIYNAWLATLIEQ